MYYTTRFYILCQKFNFNTKHERDVFEHTIESYMNLNLCRDLILVNINECDLFFIEEPKNPDDFIVQFVGIIRFEHNYIHDFCARKAGRNILEQFVFPKIPLDDYKSQIRLDPLYVAIGFYLKVGFKFLDVKVQAKFDNILKRFRIEDVTKVIEVLVSKEELTLPKYLLPLYDELEQLIEYIEDEDVNEMYWSRKNNLCAVCLENVPVAMCSICHVPICGDKCFTIHKKEHVKKIKI